MNPLPPPPPQQTESRPPPELRDDVLAEIFSRIPPDDPAILVRVSAVCKPWRRLLSGRIFLSRYHALHRAPPILGFFCEEKALTGPFSSFTYAWSDPTSIDHHPNARVQARRPSVLVGNARLYFLCDNNTSIVEFDMATMTLSVIPSPPLAGPGHEEVCGALLVTAEGGGLGFAAILKQSRTLHQWSKEEATNQWKHLEHVRDLEQLLPYTVGVHLHDPFSRMSNLLIGFADGVIVVRTHDGVFTVELGSSRPPKKVSRRSAIVAAFPYLSFCTPVAN
uniref:F-box domain-containing protein n=1 Tax=Oryza barthii TaxID=65489 RepID=A0A0D3GEX0_9ORYZ